MATNHPKVNVKWEILNRHSTREAYVSERLLAKIFQKRYGERHDEEKTPLQVKSQWMCVRCYGKPSELPACGMARLETHLETECVSLFLKEDPAAELTGLTFFQARNRRAGREC